MKLRAHMTGRLSSGRLLHFAVAAVLLMPSTSSAQTPRTPWGDPDLQGTWNNGTVTPFERPAQFAGKEFLTQEEAAKFEQIGRAHV